MTRNRAAAERIDVPEVELYVGRTRREIGEAGLLLGLLLAVRDIVRRRAAPVLLCPVSVRCRGA